MSDDKKNRFRVIEGGENTEENAKQIPHSLEDLARIQNECDEKLKEIGIEPFGYSTNNQNHSRCLEENNKYSLYEIIDIYKKGVNRAKKYIRDRFQHIICK